MFENPKDAFGQSSRARLRHGTLVEPFELTDIAGRKVRIPDPDKLTHLQFRRFAGCPVCDLHLRSFVRHHFRIEEAGIREVAFFHSGNDDLRAHAADLPFHIVADPAKRFYAQFGVEEARRSLLDPRVFGTILKAVFVSLAEIIFGGRPVPSLNPGGGRFGLPADFLLAADGRIVACKYGEHAGDHWTVEQMMEFAVTEWSRD